MSREDIRELLPEKVFIYDKGPWEATDIHNSAIDSCTDILVKTEANVDDIIVVLWGLKCECRGMAVALKEEFTILKRIKPRYSGR